MGSRSPQKFGRKERCMSVLQANDEMGQHRKWLLCHRGQLSQLKFCQVKLEITYTVGMLKCSNGIAFIRHRVELIGAKINNDRKGWPDTEVLFF
jgi:hypothetical protein